LVGEARRFADPRGAETGRDSPAAEARLPECLTMSLDRSLKSANALIRHRNVLTRGERLLKLKEVEKWQEGKSPFGLPKVGHRKAALAKAAPKEEAAEGAVAGAPAGKAAAGKAAAGKGAAPAAKGAPAGKGAAPAAKGAAPAAKKK
jgi:small basic protein (TIGR04137 family)